MSLCAKHKGPTGKLGKLIEQCEPGPSSPHLVIPFALLLANSLLALCDMSEGGFEHGML